MKRILLYAALLFLPVYNLQAQSFSINTDGSAAHGSAMLDVKSNNRGILIPRLTTAQRTAIASPGKGLLVYDSTLNNFYYHTGANWLEVFADSNKLWRKNGNDIYNANTGKVGVGISGPQSLLHVKGGAVLFDSTIGATPVSGIGTRMMWIPERGSLRAGRVTGTEWDAANIGFISFAAGFNVRASGAQSIAIGSGAVASNLQSISFGSGTASGQRSFSLGAATQASGSIDAFAIGYATISSGAASFAGGEYSIASGNQAFSFGDSCRALGNQAVAFGDSSAATGAAAFSMGSHNIASGTYSIAAGYRNSASGINGIAMGYRSIASGDYSIALEYSTASGEGAIAMGTSVANGDYSVSIGQFNTVNGSFGNAWGSFNTVTGNSATALGSSNIASGTLAIAAGSYLKSKSFGGTVTGLYNDSTNAANPLAINSLNRIFQVGNGTADNARSNALTILQNGNIGIGELNPAVPLNFTSTLGNKIALWGNGTNHYGLGIQAFTMQLYSATLNDDIAFGYGNSGAFTEKVRFKGNGNVGIGIDPVTKLHVAGNETSVNGEAAAIRISNTASTNNWILRTGAAGTATPADGFSIGDNSFYRFAITVAGDVGIATMAPTAKLSVNGTANNTTGAWGVFSDARIKDASTDFTDGLNVIKQIRPVKFRYSNDAPFHAPGEQVGVLAQELEKIAPYMVSQKKYEKYNDLREVNNQAYTFLLINAVKEQQVQIEEQKAIISDLLKRLTLVEKKINN